MYIVKISGGVGICGSWIGDSISDVAASDRLYGDATQERYWGETSVQVCHAFCDRRWCSDFLH